MSHSCPAHDRKDLVKKRIVTEMWALLNKCSAPFKQRLYTILQEPFSFSGSLNRLKKERKWPLR
jgi:hypothetical protein